jgi:hypothetical protein
VVVLNKVDLAIVLATQGFYVTGTWTPVFSFDVPGDVAFTYSIQTGTYTKLGNRVLLTFRIFGTVTHTTATDRVTITGLPYAPSDDPDGLYTGSLYFSGITMASYTQFMPIVDSDENWIYIGASGSGQTSSLVGATNIPTGSSMVLYGQVQYKTDD